MTGTAAFRVLGAAAIVVLAAALRLPALDARPMHADEAVHAAKFGALLERGEYRYDPAEYHGPTLNYLTLAPARLRGTASYADLDEATLRSVPAVAGVLLVAAHFLLTPLVGYGAAAAAALLAAVSPAMVYYSRYYIHETLLVAFSFGALLSICRYLRQPRLGWALGAGASFGLMAATKETWVIPAGAMAVAYAASWVRERRARDPAPVSRRAAAAHLAAAAVTAVGLAGLLLSSFLTHPQGLADAVAAYSTYLTRGAGESWHIHPWYDYFDRLFVPAPVGGPVWTEAAIGALALVGAAGAIWPRRDVVDERRWLTVCGVYAAVTTAAYVVMPYKTPWCVLGFLHAFILLAGAGAARLVAASPTVPGRVSVIALTGLAASHLAWLAWAGSARYASDPRNPWVYAHTGTGVFKIARRVEDLARAHPLGSAMPVEVISAQNLWPLPWYLRRLSAVRWETAPVNNSVHAPLILTTPDMEEALVTKLYSWRPPGQRELYVPAFGNGVELRPQVEVRGYAAQSLWDLAAVR